jgi:hypothetical protein
MLSCTFNSASVRKVSNLQAADTAAATLLAYLLVLLVFVHADSKDPRLYAANGLFFVRQGGAVNMHLPAPSGADTLSTLPHHPTECASNMFMYLKRRQWVLWRAAS